jgi:hypothetical protein
MCCGSRKKAVRAGKSLSGWNCSEIYWQRLDRVRNPLNFINRDVWDIETLFERLDWLRGMLAEGTISLTTGGRISVVVMVIV